MSTRVTDAMVEHWLIWARNLGEIVAFNSGKGPYKYRKGPRRFRVRVPLGITNDGNPPRPQQGLLDIFGHTPEDVVPTELMLTAREALVFGMGCAVGRTAALMEPEHDWQRERREAWTPEVRENFIRWRDEAREANKADLDRERDEYWAEHERAKAERQRRKEAASRVLEGGEDNS